MSRVNVAAGDTVCEKYSPSRAEYHDGMFLVALQKPSRATVKAQAARRSYESCAPSGYDTVASDDFRKSRAFEKKKGRMDKR